ncbi:chemotaxis protein CheW [Paraburkholderia unamae]|jgi:chemotaxis-related protein WspD|uniref:Chemotaxis protein CheW n=1 Tax=Paraburkholderia unamae TaxID=219649 RepID=A0ABX5KBL1_9BURK|nr:chemotaxis protein CheW [Paraburkholderia unamae]PVX70932.1 chemotaxis-related protein WspD [Paraburkholderia unamae]CAG9253170.1 Chemotaxis signal transduction protein [Paraburkholderia unamae]
MPERDLLPDTALASPPPSMCWKVIGTLGDNSCPRLEQCVRCLNCPVFEDAAARMLDRPAPPVQALAPAVATPARAQAGQQAGKEGSLVFRVGAEWLALPATVLRHVDEARAIHTLPHRRSAAVLGVVNVRGVLTLAASLAALLHIEPAASGAFAAGQRAATPRLLVTEWAGATTAFPVDDVEGVASFSADELLPAPATLAQSAGRHVRGVTNWRARSVGVLDADALFDALARSLR